MPNHLTERDVKWALAHLQQFGDTDLFPRPFEIDLLNESADDVVQHVRALDLGQHRWKDPRRALVLKDELSFRSATQLDPLDAVIFAAIIRHDCKRIEARRGSRTDRVFSYPVSVAAKGTLYGPDGYRDFWKKSAEAAGSAAFVLATDISDFYNQIYHHTLEQELDQARVEKAAQHALKNLLKRCSSTTSRGLPIGPHAAHLLAELSLRQVDELLVQQGVRYVRFVDDIHVFCDSRAQAHRVLQQLAQVLDLVKLQLNRTKTRLMSGFDWFVVASKALEEDPINDDERELIARLTLTTAGPYATLVQTQMTPDLLATLERTRVVGIINAYLSSSPIDFIRFRWFLRRLTQTCSPSAVELLVERFSEIAPAAADAVRYLRYALPNYAGDAVSIGEKLLPVLDDPIVAASPYLRLIVLSLFANAIEINHLPKLLAMFPSVDALMQREIILAATAAKADGWVRTLKPLVNQDPWVRRAVLLSSALWTDDERKHWKRSVRGRYDFVDDLILDALPERLAARTITRKLRRKPAGRMV